MPPFNCSNLSVGTDAEEAPRDEHLARVEISLLSIIFLLAAFLNTGLLLSLWRQPTQRTRMRVFVFHLCLADLVVAFFQVLPQLLWDITDRFMGPDLVCRLVKYLQVLGMFASTYMIVAMTIDRYQAVCDPMVTFQRRGAGLNLPVCAVWSLSLLASLPQVFIFSRVEISPGVFDCWADFVQPWGLKAYITWTTLAIFILPIVLVVVCQVRICRTIQSNLYQKMHNEGGSLDLPPPSRASSVLGVSRARVKTVKMTVVIVLAYIICWAPFFTVQLWSVWAEDAPRETATFVILMLLSSLNSCVNPCIYWFFSGQLPKLVTILCRRLRGGKEPLRDDATVVSSFYMSFKTIPD